MTDTLYREQAQKRSRRLILIAAAVLAAGCLLAGAYSAFQDTCTGSFERSPEAVVSSFVSAVSAGDLDSAAACWHHLSYLDIETGCSEICLSRIIGTKYAVQDVEITPAAPIGGRARLVAAVTAACASGEVNTGEITLDSVASDVPWRHWKIVESTFGGPLSDPWCR